MFNQRVHSLYSGQHAPASLSQGSVLSVEGHQLPFSLHPTIGTYVNTSNPHPARAVKSLGLRSRAGFMAQPVLRLREQERLMIRRPMTRGSRPLGTPMFLESKMAKTIRRSNMVDSTWKGRKSRVQSVPSSCSPKVTPSVKILEQPGLAPRASLLLL